MRMPRIPSAPSPAVPSRSLPSVPRRPSLAAPTGLADAGPLADRARAEAERAEEVRRRVAAARARRDAAENELRQEVARAQQTLASAPGNDPRGTCDALLPEAPEAGQGLAALPDELGDEAADALGPCGRELDEFGEELEAWDEEDTDEEDWDEEDEGDEDDRDDDFEDWSEAEEENDHER